MANTLEYIADTTISGATVNTVTFSSLPQSFKDIYFIGTLLLNPGNASGYVPILPDNGAGGWPNNFGSTTRLYMGPSGGLNTNNFANEWGSRYSGGYSAGNTGATYFEWTLHNYATTDTYIGGFNQIGWSSDNASHHEQYFGGHSVWDGYSATSAPGPITNLKMTFGNYLAVGSKITVYGIGS